MRVGFKVIVGGMFKWSAEGGGFGGLGRLRWWVSALTLLRRCTIFCQNAKFKDFLFKKVKGI